jgi:autotransporter-associated beta strand protein
MSKCTRKQGRALILAATVAGLGLWAATPAVFADPATGFKQTGAGPYEYNTAVNWTSGTINGIWNSDLNLTADQIVTFGADTTLTTGWTFNHGGGSNSLTLTGSVREHTVTLGGDINIGTRSPLDSSRSVFLGQDPDTTVNGENVTVDLGGATRTLTGAGYLCFQRPITSALGAFGITANGTLLRTEFVGANTYTGATTVNGGYLNLNYACYSYSSSHLSDSAALVLGGGTIELTDGSALPNPEANHIEVVGSTTINAGASGLAFTLPEKLWLNMKTITRNPGGTLLISHASKALTNNSNVNGILGGWAVLDAGSTYDWAVDSTGGADSPIMALASASYTTLPTSGGSGTVNYKMTAATSLSGSFSVNSLKLESATGDLDLHGKTLMIESGGMLFTGISARQIKDTTRGGKLTAGSSNELIVHHYNSGGLTISAVIGNNGGNSVTLTKSGPGTLILASGVSHTYTGPTYVNEGILEVAGTPFALNGGGGAVNVNGNYGSSTLLCGSGTINRPVVLNDGARIKGGRAGDSFGDLYLGSDLTVAQGAAVAHNTIRIAGTATINGTLNVGKMGASPNFVMQNGSTLKGTGALAPYFDGSTYTRGQVTLESGATLRPGGSIGRLTVGADISHEAGSIFAWEAKGYTTETDIGTAGTDYSQVVMDSGATFDIASGALGKLYFPAGEDFAGAFWDATRTWDIITGGSSGSTGSIADGYISVFVNNDLYDGGDRMITGQGGFSTASVDDGILRLTWTAVPEPASVYGMAMGLAGLATRRIFRRTAPARS